MMDIVNATLQLIGSMLAFVAMTICAAILVIAPVAYMLPWATRDYDYDALEMRRAAGKAWIAAFAVAVLSGNETYKDALTYGLVVVAVMFAIGAIVRLKG